MAQIISLNQTHWVAIRQYSTGKWSISPFALKLNLEGKQRLFDITKVLWNPVSQLNFWMRLIIVDSLPVANVRKFGNQSTNRIKRSNIICSTNEHILSDLINLVDSTQAKFSISFAGSIPSRLTCSRDLKRLVWFS